MTNAMLRKQARHAYWQNRGRMWILFLMLAVLNSAWYFIQKYLLPVGSLSPVLSIVYSLAVMPVTTFGLDLVLLRLIRGQKVRTAMIFDVFKAPYHPLKMYAASVVMLLPSLLINTVSLTGVPVISSYGQTVAYSILVLVMIVLFIWLYLRLFLFPYLVVSQPDAGIWELTKTSFQQMKGQVRHLIWFMITVTYPIGILFIVLLILLFNNIQQPNIAQTVTTVFLIVNSLITLFVLPYIYLSYAAFANKLLQTKQ